MAELADAHDSKSCPSNRVWVRLPPSAPLRKSQRVLVRLASLGDQIVFNFGDKNELAVSHFGGRKFFNHMDIQLPKIKLVMVGVIIGGVITAGGFYLSLYSKPNVVISKDETEIFEKLKNVFEEVMQLDKDTDTRIYAPSFPHYKREFVEFEEANPSGIENLTETLRREEQYAAQNSEYKAYRDATLEQSTKLTRWEYRIKDGKTLSDSLFSLVKFGGDDKNKQDVFKEYAEASKSFWALEEKYYWSQWCYRALQLSQIDNCLKNRKQGYYAENRDENLDEERNAALLTVSTLQKRVESAITD